MRWSKQGFYCLAHRALKNAPQRVEVASPRVLGHNECSSELSSVFTFRRDRGRTQSGGGTVAEPPHPVQADFGAAILHFSAVGGFLRSVGIGPLALPSKRALR